MTRALQFLLAVCSAVIVAAGATAEPSDGPGTPIKRELLALYNSTREGGADATRIHRFAELPLNHLGYVLEYRDVSRPLPSVAETNRFAGVISWLVGPVPDGDDYLTWLKQVVFNGTRLVVLGELGAPVTARNIRLANTVLSVLGLEHQGVYISTADGSHIVTRDSAFYDFECRLDPVLPAYPILERAATGSRPILEVQTPGPAGGRRTSLVAIGSGGGFAAFNFEFCHQTAPLHRGKWLIDPFAFFQAALGAPRAPVPDITTLSGRRLYFSIAHSEGWSASVEAWAQRQPQQIAAQIAARELIEAFPSLPVTLDLRDEDVSRTTRNSALARGLADHVLALPQVSRPGKHAVASKLARFDAQYDSISNLTPVASNGSERVLLAAMSSERGYVTAPASSPLAFLGLRETLAGTELPRRLKPANINFHVNVATDRALLGILRQHLRAVGAAAIAPVPASVYADIAQGFFSARLEKLRTSAWRIRERGMLQTLRLDSAPETKIDLRASRGVIGYTHHGGALYIALDEAVDVADVVLAAREDGHDAEQPAAITIGLIDSRWRLRNLVRGPAVIGFEALGYGPGEFAWRVEPGDTFTIAARRGTQSLWTGSATADAQGRLAFTVPADAIEPLSLEMARVNR